LPESGVETAAFFLFGADLVYSFDLIAERFVRPGRDPHVAAQHLVVKSGEVQRDGERGERDGNRCQGVSK